MKSLLIGGVILGLTSAIASADTTSLKQALASAYQSSPALEEARTGILNLDEAILQEKAGLLPTVSGSLSYSATNSDPGSLTNPTGQSGTRSASVNISQLLYDGGQTRGRIDAAKLTALAGRMNLIDAEQSILLSAISIFIDVRAAQSTLNLNDNNVRVLRQQVQAARDRFEVGEVTRTDVSLAEARLASAISGREAARASVLTQSAIYESVIGSPPHRLGNPGGVPNFPRTLSALENIAKFENPTIAAARFNYDAAKLNLLVARRNLVPTVTANIGGAQNSTVTGRYTGNGTDGNSASASITATVPIYQGGRLKSAQRIAANNLDVARLQLTQAENTMRADLRSAYSNFQAAQAEKRARQEQIRASQIAYEGTLEEANLGARTTLDVLDAEQDLLQARTDLVSASRNELIAAYSVLAEIGRLNPQNLGLQVEEITPPAIENPLNSNSALGKRRLKLLEKIEQRHGKK